MERQENININVEKWSKIRYNLYNILISQDQGNKTQNSSIRQHEFQ